ncbi:MAG: acyltransferase [Syntrophaceae bacterium]|nr:acyltransferase [Syntrophaceae bacterium]
MRTFTGFLRGVTGAAFLVLNTLFWAVPVYITALFKLILPFRAARGLFDTILNSLSYAWIYCINAFIDLIKTVEYDIEGLEKLKPDEWYLVIANHQSLVDIIVLQKIFHGRIPFLKYFLKKEMIWIPILGLAWWALDYPFMQRYSAEVLRKKPHFKGKDIAATRKACAKFKDKPASFMNFVEGTRFTPAKHAMQNSPYKHLLKPRSGGISYVLSAMGENMRNIIDVTIVYPDGTENAWGFISSTKSRIIIRIKVLPIDENLRGQNPDDQEYKKRFNAWLNTIWKNKDKKITQLIKSSKTAASAF